MNQTHNKISFNHLTFFSKSDVKKNANWIGRPCCNLARSQQCRGACVRAGNRQDLRNLCRWSDEPRLAECLDRRDETEECCDSVTDSTCRSACREVLSKSTKRTQALKLYNAKGCFHQVPKCMKGEAEDKATDDPKMC